MSESMPDNVEDLQVEVRRLRNELERAQSQLVKMDEALNADIDSAIERTLKLKNVTADSLRLLLGARWKAPNVGMMALLDPVTGGRADGCRIVGLKK